MAQSTTSDGTTFKQDVQGLGRGVSTLADDVNNLAHGAVDAARSGATELRHGARHAVAAAKDKLDGAKDAASEATESFKGVISRNPLASVGIAAGVGILFGLFVLRRKS